MYNIQGTLRIVNSGFKFYLFLKGDILFSDVANFIPTLAIFYALVSSLNSVGVSIYQEQLFKVNSFFNGDQGMAMFVFFEWSLIYLPSSKMQSLQSLYSIPKKISRLLQLHFL